MTRCFAKCTGDMGKPLEVVKVLVAEPEFFDTYVDPDGPGRWVETKKGMHAGILYNSDGTQAADQSPGFRYNYAGPGMLYDVEADAFYRKQPFASWTLDTSTYTWQPPVTKPSGNYRWNEEKYQAALQDSSDTSVAWVPFT